MIQGLRAKFASSPAPAPSWIISGDLSYGSFYGQFWDVAVLKNYMNYFNIMVYDMYGPWTAEAGPNSALFQSTLPGASGYPNTNGAWSVAYYLGRGVPAAQLQYGLAFYGDRYDVEDIFDTCPGSSCNSTYSSYTSIQALVGAGWTRSYDSSSECPYLRWDSGARIYTYDDPQSILAKASWATSQGLGGVFAWEITQDEVGGTHPLLDAMWAGVQCLPPSPTRTPSPTLSPTPSPSWSASPTAAGTFSSTPTPSPTLTASPPANATPRPDGLNRIKSALAYPNPGATELWVELEGPCDELELSIFGPALAKQTRSVTGPYLGGWNRIPLDPSFLAQAPNGLYYFVAVSRKMGEKGLKDARGKFYILK
jgi:hypothetical protein